MKNPVYDMMINNLVSIVSEQDPLNPSQSDIDPFEATYLIARLLCKKKEEVMNDYLKASLESYESNSINNYMNASIKTD
jgi:hypothetical protein